MSKPKTRTLIVLDRSGSMGSIRNQAVQNYNEQVQQMKENAKDQEIFCSVVSFNGNVVEHLWNEPAEKLEEATYESYVPSGGTALWDAVGYSIKKLLNAGDDENTATLVVIISDGEETSSTHYSSDQVRALIEECQGTGRWTFSYLGCDERHLKKIAQQTAIPISNMAVWSNTSQEAAQSSLGFANTRRDSYYRSRNKGVLRTANLYSDVSGESANFAEPAIVDDFSNVVDNSVNNSVTSQDSFSFAANNNFCRKGVISPASLSCNNVQPTPTLDPNKHYADVFSNGNKVTF